MHVEAELEQWLTSNIPDSRQHKQRNMRAVLNFYGFGDIESPTLEELSIVLNVGTRERARQLLNKYFRDRAELGELTQLTRACSIIESHRCISLTRLRSKLGRRGLAAGTTSIRGLLRLAKDLGACQGFEIYDGTLRKLVRAASEFEDRAYLIHKSVLPRLKRHLRTAYTLPGQLGLARFHYLQQELDNDEALYELMEIVRSSDRVCVVPDVNGDWYALEDRQNTLISFCEKVFSQTEACNARYLSEALANALRRRSQRHQYPNENVIRAWMNQSKWFTVRGESVGFLGQKRELTPLETELVQRLKEVSVSHYPPLRSHLAHLGYSKPTIDKTITTSPLVWVDKSGNRGNYTYRLVFTDSNSAGGHDDIADDRYETYKNRLKALLATGTDARANAIARREQDMLRDWLFGNQEYSSCAICGRKFSVSALVTAHKKKRAICTDAERVDPNIVFPLCKFGCDFLYEMDFVRIVDGEVAAIDLPNVEGHDIRRAEQLAGRKIDPRWLRGPSGYFAQN